MLEMVLRKPTWPGLLKDGKYRYSVNGDGNCLFASLSDQLYGTFDEHYNIRTKVVEHMREKRDFFEGFCILDDLTQRRATRSATSRSPDKSRDEEFDIYMSKMARPGVYGGHPELIAFCQVYDQDVNVYLPQDSSCENNPMFFTNIYRDQKPAPPPLHIAYAGDDAAVCTGHYDSARNRDGSHPPISTPQTPEVHATSASSSDSENGNHPGSTTAPTARAIRSGRSELSQMLIRDMAQKSREEANNSFESLSPRARSNSITSSHRSSSSKRSLDDDGDNPRRKRADRRKSKGKRTEMSTVSYEYDDDQEPPSNTPASTQDTETSSGADDHDPSDTDGDYQPGRASDSDTTRVQKRKIIKPSSRFALTKSSTTKPTHQVKIPERPRPTTHV